MAEDLQDSNKKRLFYSLINIEAQSLSVNGQTLVFQNHTLIIVSEGQGWLEAEEKRFPLEKGVGFLFEPGLISKINAEERGLSFYRLTFEVIETGEAGRVEWKRGLKKEYSSPVR